MAASDNQLSRWASPRTIGAVYLSYFATAALGALLTRGIVVSGNAASTAANILAHEGLYRAGFALDLLANVIYIVLAALFYELFRTVNSGAALVTAFCGLAGCIVQIVGDLLTIAAVVLLKAAPLRAAYDPAQIQAAAFVSITLQAEAIRLAILLFAVFDLLIGYLLIRSRLVPRPLGWFMIVAGISWLTILWPPLAVALRPIILPMGGLAEIALMLWLIVKGTDARLDISPCEAPRPDQHVRPAAPVRSSPPAPRR